MCDSRLFHWLDLSIYRRHFFIFHVDLILWNTIEALCSVSNSQLVSV